MMIRPGDDVARMERSGIRGIKDFNQNPVFCFSIRATKSSQEDYG
ncbi:hypothetical protein COXBURSA331_A2149 [Coxiella burnetii RSA 331]|nr:hypothetical protein COXBURSA331_A2149 [Coxiella burnetii RSA 331]EDR36160.1 hypothetical protein COXBURSA334_0128 [Coxiella burnetii Q321]